MLSLWVIRRSLHIDKIHKIVIHSFWFQLCYQNVTNVAKNVNLLRGRKENRSDDGLMLSTLLLHKKQCRTLLTAVH